MDVEAESTSLLHFACVSLPVSELQRQKSCPNGVHTNKSLISSENKCLVVGTVRPCQR